MMFRYFSFPERSRRAHIRVFKAIGDARNLTKERLKGVAEYPGKAESIFRAEKAFDDLVGHTERCLNFYLPQTWQGGADEQQPRGDNL